MGNCWFIIFPFFFCASMYMRSSLASAFCATSMLAASFFGHVNTAPSSEDTFAIIIASSGIFQP